MCTDRKGGRGSGAYQPTSAVTPGTTTPPASRYRPTVLYAVLYGTLVLRIQTSLSLYHTVLLITCTVLYSNTSLQYSSRYRWILTTESDFRGNLRSIQYTQSRTSVVGAHSPGTLSQQRLPYATVITHQRETDHSASAKSPWTPNSQLQCVHVQGGT